METGAGSASGTDGGGVWNQMWRDALHAAFGTLPPEDGEPAAENA